LGILLGIPALYVFIAWFVYARWARLGLVASCLASSLLTGYLLYRYTCSQPLTCDVGGTSKWFFRGSPYYFTHYVPLFTAISLVSLGLASVVVALRHRPGTHIHPWPGTVVLGSAIAVAAFMLTFVILGLVSRLTNAAA
jgi:hypothetical protein